jgi:mRNA interferase RelE/StbE
VVKKAATAANEGAMKYEIEIKDEAKAELRALPEAVRREIGYRLHLLQHDFSGDVKKLRGSKNEYRLRAGNYRVLFELVGKRIVVYTLGQRKDIYR